MGKKYLFFVIVTMALISVFFIPQLSYSFYIGKLQQSQSEYSSTRLIVKLKPEVDKKVVLGKTSGKITTGISKIDELNSKFSVQNQKKLFSDFKETALKTDKLSSIYILEVPDGTDLKQMKKEYENRSEVEYVEFDYKLELFEQPNDPLFVNQWYLNNTGQGYLGINRIPGDSNDTQIIKFGTFDADIDALETWQRNDQTVPVLVGIIDTGVDLDHEDLAANIWTNPGEIPNNGIDDDHNGFVDDVYGWDFAGSNLNEITEDNDPTDTYGHGTHCAGIVASVRGNGIGISGINTPCKIVAIKCFPDNSGGTLLSLAAKSIIYAADMGCNIINMSWGSAYPSKVVEEAINYAVSKNVLPIAAAGNSGAEDNFYPASYANVFTVGASNSKDEVTYFSTYGEQVEVVAPGEDILSLRADNTDMYADEGASGKEPNVHIVNQKYYLADGTSMASPCAVGVAAYIMSASPGISNDRVIEVLEQSADDIIYPYGGDSLYSPGKDIYSGYGRVNLNSALQLLSGRLAKINYPYENAIVSGEVAVLGTASGANFDGYTLEYGEGGSPTNWTQITSSTVPVINDTLGVLNSSGLTGLFTIRLTVGDQNQAIVHIIANNNTYVKITSPDENDTVEGYAQIKGYTIVPDFSEYTLEYGYGSLPSSWYEITVSTKTVAGDILGNWLVSFEGSGDYALRLTVKTNTGQTHADTVAVYVKSIASGGWAQELSSYGSLSPAIGDIDGDGYDEIVVGVGWPQYAYPSTGGIEVFRYDGKREPGWPKDIGKNMMSSPALGDLDGDGVDDIVICSNLGVHAYLSNSSSWFRSAGTGASGFWSLATPVIADLDNDGQLEVLTINNQGTVYAWHGNGQPVISGSNGVFAHVEASLSARAFPCLAVADLDRDGKNEIIAASAYKTCDPEPCKVMGGIYIWDTNGNLLLKPGDYPDDFAYIFGIAIANIDENPDLEVIVLGATKPYNTYNTLCAFKKNGAQAAGFPIVLEGLDAGWWWGNHPAIGDLDGDGILEIVVSIWTMGEARIYAWHQNGTPLGSAGSGGLLVSMKSPNSEKERQALSNLGNNMEEMLSKLNSMNEEERTSFISTFQDTALASADETFGSPILADVNGDGNVDIVVRAGYLLGTGYERVFAWDYEGNFISGWPLYATVEPNISIFYPYTPIVADMDKDGKLNMVLITQKNNYATSKLLSWEFDTHYDLAHMHWPKYMHDKYNRGLFRIEDYSIYEVSDITYLINYLFKGGTPPDPIEHGDVNCDGIIDIADVVYLINYLYRAGPPPCR